MLGVGLAMHAFGCIFTVPECLHCGEQGSGGGGGGGTPAGCVPSESASGVGEECGIFVAANGDDAASGTKAAPVKSIAKAIEIAEAKGSRVYACAEEFGEAVEVPAGVTIFGGLDCANGWAWIGETTKTTVVGPADAIAVKLLGGEGTTRIEDVAVRAADATVMGGSSIAVLADGATAELARCELTAGDGAAGEAGASAPMDAPPQAAAGSNGSNACSDLDMMGGPDATLPGGAQVVNDCGGGDISVGGTGGNGNITNGGDGSAGQTGTLGQPGLGEPVNGAGWACAAGLGLPNSGEPGASGDPGTAASGLGSLSSTGYTGVSAGAGTPGKAGQGGGGGGGAKGGNAICPGGTAGAGASGGSGGAGGCGGQPGQGGGPGGASIALASMQATVTLTDCTLTAGHGGMGGPGGNAQPGGAGGVAGQGGQTGGIVGIKAACPGGQGGQGGDGGPGGGGLGGPSLAVAFTGTAPGKVGTTTLSPGTAGLGGPGGSSNAGANAGMDGITASEQEFP